MSVANTMAAKKQDKQHALRHQFSYIFGCHFWSANVENILTFASQEIVCQEWQLIGISLNGSNKRSTNILNWLLLCQLQTRWLQRNRTNSTHSRTNLVIYFGFHEARAKNFNSRQNASMATIYSEHFLKLHVHIITGKWAFELVYIKSF